MGGDLSSCVPAQIANLSARVFYDDMLTQCRSVSSHIQKQKKFRKMIKIIFESLKKLPASTPEFSIIITGDGMGPVYINNIFPSLSSHAALTKISFRHSGFKSKDCPSIALFLINCPTIKEFDISENDLKDNAYMIINACCGLKNLNTLIMESCGINESSAQSLLTIIANSRTLKTLRVVPCSFQSNTNLKLKQAINANDYIQNSSFGDKFDSSVASFTSKNCFIYEIVDSISRAPYQRQFRKKIDTFKSVKGRQMLEGKARQKEQAKGTELFNKFEEAEKRAKSIETNETVQTTQTGRFAAAETTGRRPQMEDVSIIQNNMPKPGSTLFALFDGHGGRDAAEFAAENLPKAISEKVKSGEDIKTAYTDSFKSIQAEMSQWCVYVGTTVVIATVDPIDNILTVANVGDSRCVLCRGGKAVRLTADHKPDDEEEKKYILSKGGIVKDGRIGGMLGVSRALGDGFLSDCVNSTPHIQQVKLTEEDSFIILACDGVWDVISDQEAVDMIASEIDPLSAAKLLRDRAFELESTDNISVIVSFLSIVVSNDE